MAGTERRQKILFAVLGVLVLVFFFKMFMGGGGSGDGGSESADRGSVTTTIPVAVNPSEDEGETDSAPPADSAEGAFDAFAGRNPFEPVVSGDG